MRMMMMMMIMMTTTMMMMMISGTHGDISPYGTISADPNPYDTISAGPTMAQRPQRGHWRLCGCGAKAGCVTAIASLGKQPVPSTTCEPSIGWVQQPRNRS